jgi:hypothetical protein
MLLYFTLLPFLRMYHQYFSRSIAPSTSNNTSLVAFLPHFRQNFDFRQHQQVALAMFPYYYFIPSQILIAIVEDIVTLLIIILDKIDSIRTFNVQLTLRGYVICPII